MAESEKKQPKAEKAAAESRAEKKPKAVVREKAAAEKKKEAVAEKNGEAAKKPEKKGKAAAKKRPKSKEAKALAEKIRKKKRLLFRGRFGNRSIRKKSKKKWQKWRKPRGIDIYRQQEDGLYPKTGYRTAKEIRGRHPSGYDVVLVRNEAELEQAKGENAAVLFASVLGKRKRKLLLEKAEKKGIAVLNG